MLSVRFILIVAAIYVSLETMRDTKMFFDRIEDTRSFLPIFLAGIWVAFDFTIAVHLWWMA